MAFPGPKPLALINSGDTDHKEAKLVIETKRDVGFVL